MKCFSVFTNILSYLTSYYGKLYKFPNTDPSWHPQNETHLVKMYYYFNALWNSAGFRISASIFLTEADTCGALGGSLFCLYWVLTSVLVISLFL